ncbi:MAG: hypothetical protein KDD42_10255 [Bdellovibrionales bacterium]|nr:hypothetical protein [Bdellovibrionales bacterium]
MAHFRPDRDRTPPKLFRERPKRPPLVENLIVGTQLFLIFAVLRLTMVMSGMLFVRIPLLDPVLLMIGKYLKTFFERF